MTRSRQVIRSASGVAASCLLAMMATGVSAPNKVDRSSDMQRGRFEDALTHSPLGVDTGTARLIAHDAPTSIVQWVSRYESPRIDVGRAVAVTAFHNTHAAESSQTTGDLFFACSAFDPPALFLGIVARSALRSEIVWDTAMTFSLTLPRVRTISLGIEARGLITFVVSGLRGVSSGHVLVSWDGKRGSVLGILTNGPFTPLDIDGDGIMELSVMTGGVGGEPMGEEVYKFDRASRAYELISGLKTGRYEKKDQR